MGGFRRCREEYDRDADRELASDEAEKKADPVHHSPPGMESIHAHAERIGMSRGAWTNTGLCVQGILDIRIPGGRSRPASVARIIARQKRLSCSCHRTTSCSAGAHGSVLLPYGRPCLALIQHSRHLSLADFAIGLPQSMQRLFFGPRGKRVMGMSSNFAMCPRIV